MREHKTGKKSRTNYVYYTADRKRITITPDDVDELWITFLHEMDDKEYNSQRRENYHITSHYDSYSDTAGEGIDDRNSYLINEEADPLEQMLMMISDEEYWDKMNNLKKAVSELAPEQRNLIKEKFFNGKSNVAIAKMEGVSEAAIRKRLKAIYAILTEKI